MKRFRLAGALASVAVLAGAALSGASPASADEIWHQGIERAGERAACPKSSGDELASGWSEWAPSWAEWANNGKGGFVCERANVWARSGGGDVTLAPVAPRSGYPSGVGCVDANLGEDFVNFLGGFYLPAGATIWKNNSCTTPRGATYSNPRVYAPAGFDASALCQEFAGPSYTYTSGPWGNNNYECRMTPYVC